MTEENSKPPDYHSWSFIVCPWCFCGHSDDGFKDQTGMEVTCDHCEKVFWATITTSRDYSTTATKPE